MQFTQGCAFGAACFLVLLLGSQVKGYKCKKLPQLLFRLLKRPNYFDTAFSPMAVNSDTFDEIFRR
jgi:hypothetical protein